MAGVRAVAESIFQVVNHTLAGRRERVVARQGLHDAGIVVATSKEYGSMRTANHRLPLHIATHADRCSARSLMTTCWFNSPMSVSYASS